VKEIITIFTVGSIGSVDTSARILINGRHTSSVVHTRAAQTVVDHCARQQQSMPENIKCLKYIVV
jgi:hypothetical protein